MSENTNREELANERLSERDASSAYIDDAPDQELVHRVLTGELKCFEALMRRYNRRLFRIARSILRSEIEAEDVVQESYVRAYLKLSEFRGPRGFASWLTRIAVNEALGRRRRADFVTEAMAEDDLEHLSMEESGMPHLTSAVGQPDEIASNDELRRLLQREIDALPAPYRVAFMLREVEQLTVKETAECLGIQSTTVKTRVHRAKKRLQRALREEIESATRDTYPFAGQRCDRIVDQVYQRIASLTGQQRGCGDHH